MLRRGWMTAALCALCAAALAQAQPVKRSLSALARTSQLPHSSTNPVDQSGHDQDNHNSQPNKRSVAALARAGELPSPAHSATVSSQQKRDSMAELLQSLRQEEAIREAVLRRAAELADLYGYRDGYRGLDVERRSVSSLARHGNLPASAEKRSVASLVRSGNLPVIAADKRSVEALARNGLLPSKRGGVSALARAGDLPGKRGLLLEALQRELEEGESYAGKRSVSSLAKSGDLMRPNAGETNSYFPLAVLEQQVKRSLEALARNWNLPDVSPKRSQPYGAYDVEEELPGWGRSWGKRNAAALLRQTKFSTSENSPGIDEARQEDVESEMAGSSEKRYLGALRGSQGSQGGRRKRSVWDEDDWGEDLSGEVAAPYVQVQTSGQPDWEELLEALAEDPEGREVAAAPQKRFLGSVARSWGSSSWRPAAAVTGNSAVGFSSDVSKRHIGALARLGLLPSFRSLRALRYSRSGRAVQDQDGSRRWHRVCYLREDPEYGTASTKDKRRPPEAAAPPLDWPLFGPRSATGPRQDSDTAADASSSPLPRGLGPASGSYR